MDRRETAPSSRADIEAQAKAEALAKAEARASNMREDFTRTFQTAHGKRVMAWLAARCGHNKIILSADRQTGRIDPEMTVFAAMELNLYLEIRKHLPTELLQEIEDVRRIEPSGTIRDDDNGGIKRVTRKRRRKPD